MLRWYLAALVLKLFRIKKCWNKRWSSIIFRAQCNRSIATSLFSQPRLGATCNHWTSHQCQTTVSKSMKIVMLFTIVPEVHNLIINPLATRASTIHILYRFLSLPFKSAYVRRTTNQGYNNHLLIQVNFRPE